METKDPFEQSIKERFKEAQKTTDVPTWQAVASSLKQRKRRRYVIWLWSSTGVLTLLALLWLAFTGDQKLAPETTEPVQITISSGEDTSTNPINTKQDETLAAEADTGNPVADQSAVTDSDASDNKTKSENTSTSIDSSWIEDFTKEAQTTPTYYYYDSKTGKQVSTTDKSVIDSLILKKAVLTPKDSLQQ